MTFAHRIAPGSRVSLADIDPDDHGSFTGKDDPRFIAQLTRDLQRLGDLQQRLYAEQQQSLLVVLQAMDTAGKDGVLRHVVGPLDSRGMHVWSFREPSREELSHDFLWRFHPRVPAKGEIAFFNRSYYEDVLVVRVMELVPKNIWKQRYERINAFEQSLGDSSHTRVVKFFLHISKEEQRKRLQERIDLPEKHWKYDPRDLEARERWDDYQRAYETVLDECSTDEAPWYVVPANHKWFRNLAVAEVLAQVLEKMAPKYPEPAIDLKKIKIK
jgi:PPK2 family polyphosphate:nucleotide phosphotransferase